eukprot:gene13138-17606_t
MEEKHLKLLNDNGWIKEYSKKYQQDYWFNTIDGRTSWTSPNILTQENSNEIEVDVNHKIQIKENDETNRKCKRKAIELESEESISDGQHVKILKEIDTTKSRIAIIVPFRDLNREQMRGKQLTQFIKHFEVFLQGQDYKLYILEQSNDARKFNRGKLLNIGFDYSMKYGNSNIFIFHDVDLLPSDDLLSCYTTTPKDNNPVHIARIWNRYNKNSKYFGGVVAFSKEQFVSINGFPNNFWGWGGEDDELFLRSKECLLEPVGPSIGSMIDLENMDLDGKLAYLKSNNILKCMNKVEVLKEHKSSWQTNGLSDLKYSILNVETKSRNCIKIIVDVQLNNHWTDNRCGITDPQYDAKAEISSYSR